jgi:prepilin-type N-terminal cleavage/methylation domain-containing protein
MERMRHAGFTLIELSIVLVVIGLIVGGILVGQDLIEAAQIRSTGKQIEQLNTAVMTFRSKYNCLPGDCDHASQLFPGAVDGNGDGDIYGTSGGRQNGGPENFGFFQHLISADLIADSRYCTLNHLTCQAFYCLNSMGLDNEFIGTGLSCGHGAISLASLSQSKNTAGSGWTAPVYVLPANHAYFFGTQSDAAYTVISPMIAFSLDNKFDDGAPLTGTIVAMGFNSQFVVDDAHFSNLSSASLGCMNRTTNPYTYKITDAGTDCDILWQTPF